MGVQLPERGEAQRQVTGGDHAQEADHQDDEDDNPVIPPALSCFHDRAP
jgi:hypothetical protein